MIERDIALIETEAHLEGSARTILSVNKVIMFGVLGIGHEVESAPEDVQNPEVVKEAKENRATKKSLTRRIKMTVIKSISF